MSSSDLTFGGGGAGRVWWGCGWLVTPWACAEDASLPPGIISRGLGLSKLFTSFLTLLTGLSLFRRSGPAFLIVSLSLFRKSCSRILSLTSLIRLRRSGLWARAPPRAEELSVRSLSSRMAFDIRLVCLLEFVNLSLLESVRFCWILNLFCFFCLPVVGAAAAADAAGVGAGVEVLAGGGCGWVGGGSGG